MLRPNWQAYALFVSALSVAACGGATDDGGSLPGPKDSGKDTSSGGDTSVDPDTSTDGSADTTPADTSVGDSADASCDPPLKSCKGACVDTTTDPDNCGVCGTKCLTTEICTGGTCTKCEDPKVRCSGVCVDIKSDVANCGACGTKCTGDEKCVAGTCTIVCDAGTTKCGSKCVTLTTDKANCGGCGIACKVDEECISAACEKVCTAPTIKCFGTCSDITKDDANCGGCGIMCSSGSTCIASKCVCGSSTTTCGGVCIDTKTDPLNCGACGKVCGFGGTCVAGACVCPSPLTTCSGVCSDLSKDTNNCGSCGKKCASAESCVAGICKVVAPKCNTGTTTNVLFYGPVGSLEKTYLPTGAITTVATDASWKAMTTADFAKYQLIVIGEGAYGSAPPWDTANGTKTTWTPAVTGRVVVHTLDPMAHGVAGATTWIKATLDWLSKGPGTALYVGPDYGSRKLDFMSGFGAWTALGQITDGVAGDDVHILLSTHGTMTGSTDSSLSSWGYSYHGAITGFPSPFVGVSNVTSSAGRYIEVAKDVYCIP